MDITLEVDRSDLRTTRLEATEPSPLEAGEVRLRVDRLALTANTVTYAVAGDMLDYWGFYPAADGWGRVPAMGWADLVESAHPDVEVGGRYYGWFPMTTSITMAVAPTADGLRDEGAHRAAHAAAYRALQRTDADPWYQAGGDAEDRQALLRGLFLTGFLLDSHLSEAGDHGATQVIVLSASSKTAIAFAVQAAARGVRCIGVTSAGNEAFVRALGCYADVVTYDAVDDIAAVSTVVVDMAGAGEVLARIHGRLGDTIAASITVGMSHHDAPRVPITAGPAPQLFFAPGEVASCIERWGPDGFRQRTTDALHEFVDGSTSWLRVERSAGPDATQAAWLAAVDGAIPPDVGRIVSMHDAATT